MNTQNTQNPVQFEVGKTYLMGWITNSDMKTPFEVIKRTNHFVTLKDPRTNETIRCKVSTWDGIEKCYPMGLYSMAPVLNANKLQN